MAEKKNVLLHLDGDEHASVFDSVVALDSGADVLLTRCGVQPKDVQALMHGLMFTRGPKDLRHSAVFIGGSSIETAETLFAAAKQALFDPLRVSLMFDPNGANTTASAAVAVAQSLALQNLRATVLGGTGPVGSRIALLLGGLGTRVRVVSRDPDRAQQVCDMVQSHHADASVEACSATGRPGYLDVCGGADVVFACGAAGASFIGEEDASLLKDVKLAIDLNAVPPAGLGWIKPTDKGALIGKMSCWGAIGVGGLKMKIHKLAIQSLFEQNNAVLDTAAIFKLAHGIPLS